MLYATRGTQAFHRFLSKTWHRIEIGLHAPIVTFRIRHAGLVPLTISHFNFLELIVRICLLEPLWKARLAIGANPRMSSHLKSATLTPCDGVQGLPIQMWIFLLCKGGLSGVPPHVLTCHQDPGFQTKLTQVLYQAPRTSSHFKCLIFELRELRVPTRFSLAHLAYQSFRSPFSHCHQLCKADTAMKVT